MRLIRNVFALCAAQSFDSVVEKCIIFLIIFMPLLFGGVGFGPQVVLFLICGFMFFGWLISHLKNKQHIFGSSMLGYLFIFLLFSLFIQVVPLPKFLLKILSPSTYKFYSEFLPGYKQYQIWRTISFSPEATKIEFFKFLSYGFLIFIIVNVINKKEQILRIMLTIVLTGFAISFFGIIQNFTWNGMIYWFKPMPEYASPFGPFVNRNHFAGFIELVLPIAVLFTFIEERLEKRVIFGFMAVVMLLSLFLCLSRGGILSFLLALLLITPVIFLRGSVGKKVFYVFLAVIFAAIFMFFLVKEPIIGRFTTGSEGFLERINIYKAIFKIFKDFPLFGVGAGSFSSIFNMYGVSSRDVIIINAESDWAQFLIELGLLGFIFLITAMLVFLKDIVFCHYLGKDRCCFIDNLANAEEYKNGIRHDRFTLFAIVAGLVSMASIFIHGFFDINLHIPSNAVFACIISALVIVLAHRNFRN